jgi:hypothetical protein
MEENYTCANCGKELENTCYVNRGYSPVFCSPGCIAVYFLDVSTADPKTWNE